MLAPVSDKVSDQIKPMTAIHRLFNENMTPILTHTPLDILIISLDCEHIAEEMNGTSIGSNLVEPSQPQL